MERYYRNPLDTKADIEMTLQVLRSLKRKNNLKNNLEKRIFEFNDPYDKNKKIRVHYPLKHQRLELLLEKGANIADFVCFAPNEFDEKKARDFFEKHKKVSVRHFHENEKEVFKCPVIYDVADFKKVSEFAKENNKKFYTLINQSIAIEDSLFCGTILWIDDGLRDRKFIMEIFFGAGTPRDIEKKNMSDLLILTGPRFWIEAPRSSHKDDFHKTLKMIVEHSYRLTSMRPIIYEFSYYPYPVGKLERNLIYWEWRIADFYRYGVDGDALIPHPQVLKK